MATEITGSVETNMEGMGSEVYTAPNSNVGVVVDVDDSMHVLPVDSGCGLQSPKQKASWSRLRRMEIGPVKFFKEGAKSVLGKRNTSCEESSTIGVAQHIVVKRVKSSGDSNLDETAGVPTYPC